MPLSPGPAIILNRFMTRTSGATTATTVPRDSRGSLNCPTSTHLRSHIMVALARAAARFLAVIRSSVMRSERSWSSNT